MLTWLSKSGKEQKEVQLLQIFQGATPSKGRYRCRLPDSEKRRSPEPDSSQTPQRKESRAVERTRSAPEGCTRVLVRHCSRSACTSKCVPNQRHRSSSRCGT